MIKATISDGTIVLGLSDENIKRLSAGEPIKFNLKDLNLEDREVFIFNGRTEESMYIDMLDMIDLKKTKLK